MSTCKSLAVKDFVNSARFCIAMSIPTISADVRRHVALQVPQGDSAEAGMAGAINGLGVKVGGLEALLALAQQRIADKADSADVDSLRHAHMHHVSSLLVPLHLDPGHHSCAEQPAQS